MRSFDREDCSGGTPNGMEFIGDMDIGLAVVELLGGEKLPRVGESSLLSSRKLPLLTAEAL